MALAVSVTEAVFDQVPPKLTVALVAVMAPLLPPLYRLGKPPPLAVNGPLFVQLPSRNPVPPLAVIGPLLTPLLTSPKVAPLVAVKFPALLQLSACTYKK